jgi:hypothetical protein
MPSSTSSSDTLVSPDKYGRPLPSKSLGVAALVGAIVMILLMSGWEIYWRSDGSIPSYRNSEGLWAIQRRRIDNGEGDKTVIAGSSRAYFNMQLDVWERESGERPIQLALEGTSPVKLMENLAEDEDFTGTLVIGVAPGPFFGGGGYRAKAFKRYEQESPSQWLGQRLSMLVEPYLAFYHYDYSLFTVIARQEMKNREGVEFEPDVRRLATYARDRAARMYWKVEEDDEYARIAQEIWAAGFTPIEEEDKEELDQFYERRAEVIDRAIEATKRLQERGIEVIFFQSPAEGHYAISEPMYYPRQETWDVLIENTGAMGLHWQDHEEMQGYWLPEWSHMSGSEADRFTKALHQLIQRERANRDAGE